MSRAGKSGPVLPRPVLLSLGARPFFVLAGLWAVAAVALWPLVLGGRLLLPSGFAPVEWHAHELIFGYTGAAMAGFVLTAVANWTGRPPVAGGRLLVLVLLWLAGRLAVAGSDLLVGIGFVALGFPALLAVFVGHQIEASGTVRNRKVAALLAVFALVDVVFHLSVWFGWDSRFAARGGIAVLVMLILLIGGRVTPAFTSNWLNRHMIARTIPEFGQGDRVAMGLAIAALVGWVGWPDRAFLAGLDFAAGIGVLWRVSRWQGWTIRRDALLGILHLGTLMAGCGFLAAAGHAAFPAAVPAAMTVHVWAIGAIGVMTLAMMTRATLGHTGGSLLADRATTAAYLCLLLALAARIAMTLRPDSTGLFPLAAAAWCAGFALFVVRYAPRLISRG